MAKILHRIRVGDPTQPVVAVARVRGTDRGIQILDVQNDDFFSNPEAGWSLLEFTEEVLSSGNASLGPSRYLTIYPQGAVSASALGALKQARHGTQESPHSWQAEEFRASGSGLRANGAYDDFVTFRGLDKPDQLRTFLTAPYGSILDDFPEDTRRYLSVPFSWERYGDESPSGWHPGREPTGYFLPMFDMKEPWVLEAYTDDKTFFEIPGSLWPNGTPAVLAEAPDVESNPVPETPPPTHERRELVNCGRFLFGMPEDYPKGSEAFVARMGCVGSVWREVDEGPYIEVVFPFRPCPSPTDSGRRTFFQVVSGNIRALVCQHDSRRAATLRISAQHPACSAGQWRTSGAPLFVFSAATPCKVGEGALEVPNGVFIPWGPADGPSTEARAEWIEGAPEPNQPVLSRWIPGPSGGGKLIACDDLVQPTTQSWAALGAPGFSTIIAAMQTGTKWRINCMKPEALSANKPWQIAKFVIEEHHGNLALVQLDTGFDLAGSEDPIFELVWPHDPDDLIEGLDKIGIAPQESPEKIVRVLDLREDRQTMSACPPNEASCTITLPTSLGGLPSVLRGFKESTTAVTISTWPRGFLKKAHVLNGSGPLPALPKEAVEHSPRPGDKISCQMFGPHAPSISVSHAPLPLQPTEEPKMLKETDWKWTSLRERANFGEYALALLSHGETPRKVVDQQRRTEALRTWAQGILQEIVVPKADQWLDPFAGPKTGHAVAHWLHEPDGEVLGSDSIFTKALNACGDWPASSEAATAFKTLLVAGAPLDALSFYDQQLILWLMELAFDNARYRIAEFTGGGVLKELQNELYLQQTRASVGYADRSPVSWRIRYLLDPSDLLNLRDEGGDRSIQYPWTGTRLFHRRQGLLLECTRGDAVRHLQMPNRGLDTFLALGRIDVLRAWADTDFKDLQNLLVDLCYSQRVVRANGWGTLAGVLPGPRRTEKDGLRAANLCTILGLPIPAYTAVTRARQDFDGYTSGPNRMGIGKQTEHVATLFQHLQRASDTTQVVPGFRKLITGLHEALLARPLDDPARSVEAEHLKTLSIPPGRLSPSPTLVFEPGLTVAEPCKTTNICVELPVSAASNPPLTGSSVPQSAPSPWEASRWLWGLVAAAGAQLLTQKLESAQPKIAAPQPKKQLPSGSSRTNDG